MRFRIRFRWILALLGVVVAIAAVSLLYERTRPHLAALDQPQRAEQLRKWMQSENEWETPEYMKTRADLATAREYLLDFPNAATPRLRLKLALSVLGHPDADMTLIASEMEQAAMDVLSHFGPNQTPKKQDFEKAGFPLKGIGGGWRGPGWPDSFVVNDIDGDGRPDILLTFPGGEGGDFGRTLQKSVCCLFRHTKEGWVKSRLGLGAPIAGVWVFDIAKNGTKAILIASLANSVYDSTLFADVFVWQNGRLNSVLATQIEHSFQLDHKDVDGDGVQEILLYGEVTDRGEGKPQQEVLYRWNGSRYALAKTTSSSPNGSVLVSQGEEKMEAGNIPEAARLLQRAATWKPGKGDSYNSFDYDGRPRAWYYLGICRALLGDQGGAVAAMTLAKNAAEREDTTISIRAADFLNACQRPGDLPKALAAAGQGFRTLEQAMRSARPDVAPKDLLAATGFQIDSYQETDLTGDGVTEGLARLHWQGGSAVVALQRPAGATPWKFWILAYTQESKPPEFSWYSPPSLFFYLPQPPALQPYPVANDVVLKGVQAREGKPPQLTIAYRQGNQAEEGIVAWNGERFLTLSPLPKITEALEPQLNRIEAFLFERRDYQKALEQLTDFEDRVRSSALPPEGKTDLLLEVFYHQALCYRKLGDTRKASVTYTALWRGHPQSAWGEMAKKWLNFGEKSSAKHPDAKSGGNP